MAGLVLEEEAAAPLAVGEDNRLAEAVPLAGSSCRVSLVEVHSVAVLALGVAALEANLKVADFLAVAVPQRVEDQHSEVPLAVLAKASEDRRRRLDSAAPQLKLQALEALEEEIQEDSAELEAVASLVNSRTSQADYLVQEALEHQIRALPASRLAARAEQVKALGPRAAERLDLASSLQAPALSVKILEHSLVVASLLKDRATPNSSQCQAHSS